MNIKNNDSVSRPYIGQKGLTINKSNLSKMEQYNLTKQYTVKPYIPKSPVQPESFAVYRESAKKFYIPKFSGIKDYGENGFDNRLPEGDDINIEFKGKLRDYQYPIVDCYLNNQSKGSLLEIPCGRGKCFAKNTEVLMYDGSVKKIQDIKVGEQLMGDDSTPRNVLSLARGTQEMFKIIPQNRFAESYTVNADHILCFKEFKRFKETETTMTVLEYLELKETSPQRLKNLYGYQSPLVVFPYKEIHSMVKYSYLIGYWLVGTYNNITNFEIDCPKILAHLNNNLQRDLPDYRFRQLKDNLYSLRHKYNIRNEFKDYLSECGILRADITDKGTVKHIPDVYKTNISIARRNLLAGIIDGSNTYYNKLYNTCQIELNMSNKRLCKDIKFVFRSLGYCANYITVPPAGLCCNRGIITDLNTQVLEVTGDFSMLPSVKCLNNFKQSFNKNLLRNARYYPIEIKSLQKDDYYGFEIDGNRKFLLENYNVVHNTVLALNIISRIQKKTLVIVHKEFLMNQWIERIQQFLPDAKIGKIQGQNIDIDGKDIVLGMLQSLSKKEYPSDQFSSFGLTIIDEVHHISAQVFVRSLFKVVTKHTLGLSATMNRKDGLTPVFKMFLGDIVYSEKTEKNDNVIVKSIEYKSPDADFNREVRDYRGNVAYSTMISKLCTFNRRTEFIITLLINTLNFNKEQHIIMLSHNKNILKYLYDAITDRNIATVGYYIGGMKEKDLKISEGKKVILATYSMAAEALDIKTLSTLIMLTPKTDVVQPVGRIMRSKDHQPVVIDIVDSHDVFKRQWTKRLTHYRKQGYKIFESDSEVYNAADDSENILNSSVWTPYIYCSKRGKKNTNKGETIAKNKCLIKL